MPNAFSAARRQFLELATASGLTVAGAGLWLAGSAGAARAADDSVSPADLMAEMPLPDCWIGNADAPVTIVEYASMTCPHCAAFHAETFAKLKSDYLDTGKARFTLREFPLDPLATAAFMLARRAGDDQRNAMVDLLFAKQKDWAYAEKKIEALANIVKQAGLTQADFENCLKDQALYDKVNKMRDIADQKFKVQSTPTFFFNGKRHGGGFGPEELATLVKA